jgi:hypothetical protein
LHHLVAERSVTFRALALRVSKSDGLLVRLFRLLLRGEGGRKLDEIFVGSNGVGDEEIPKVSVEMKT